MQVTGRELDAQITVDGATGLITINKVLRIEDAAGRVIAAMNQGTQTIVPGSDVSGYSEIVQAIARTAWTPDVIKTFLASLKIQAPQGQA